MTLTQNGIDYICRNFGDIDECVVSIGIQWSYLDVDAVVHDEVGGTAQVVSRLIFPQLVQNLTMINPSRGTFTYNQLRAANGNDVTLTDCQTIISHDEESGSQWCATPTNNCINPAGAHGSVGCVGGYEATCNNGTWVKNTPEKECGTCESNTTKEECINAGCNWYAYPNPFGDPQCFSEPIFIKYLPFIAVGVGAVIVIVALASSKGKGGGYSPPFYPPPPPYYPHPPRW